MISTDSTASLLAPVAPDLAAAQELNPAALDSRAERLATREALIARLAQRRRPCIAIVPMTASRREIAAEGEALRAPDADSSILDESANVREISPMMRRCAIDDDVAPTGHHRDGEGLLTRAERTRARAELNAYRDEQWHKAHPPALWLAPFARLTA